MIDRPPDLLFVLGQQSGGRVRVCVVRRLNAFAMRGNTACGDPVRKRMFWPRDDLALPTWWLCPHCLLELPRDDAAELRLQWRAS